jgi:hypothetical protein
MISLFPSRGFNGSCTTSKLTAASSLHQELGTSLTSHEQRTLDSLVEMTDSSDISFGWRLDALSLETRLYPVLERYVTLLPCAIIVSSREERDAVKSTRVKGSIAYTASCTRIVFIQVEGRQNR